MSKAILCKARKESDDRTEQPIRHTPFSRNTLTAEYTDPKPNPLAKHSTFHRTRSNIQITLHKSQTCNTQHNHHRPHTSPLNESPSQHHSNTHKRNPITHHTNSIRMTLETTAQQPSLFPTLHHFNMPIQIPFQQWGKNSQKQQKTGIVEQTVGLHYHLYRCSYLMASRYSFMAVLFVVVTIRFFFSFQQDVYSYPLYVPIGRKSLME